MLPAASTASSFNTVRQHNLRLRGTNHYTHMFYLYIICIIHSAPNTYRIIKKILPLLRGHTSRGGGQRVTTAELEERPALHVDAAL